MLMRTELFNKTKFTVSDPIEYLFEMYVHDGFAIKEGLIKGMMSATTAETTSVRSPSAAERFPSFA